MQRDDACALREAVERRIAESSPDQLDGLKPGVEGVAVTGTALKAQPNALEALRPASTIHRATRCDAAAVGVGLDGARRRSRVLPVLAPDVQVAVVRSGSGVEGDYRRALAGGSTWTNKIAAIDRRPRGAGNSQPRVEDVLVLHPWSMKSKR